MNVILKSILAVSLGVMSIGAMAHDDATLDTMNAPNGGQLRMVGAYHLELVLAKNNKIQESPISLYLTDHAGNKKAAQGASATATIMTGKNKAVVSLVPSADNQLSGVGKYAYSPKTKVAVTIRFADNSQGQTVFTPATANAKPSKQSHEAHQSEHDGHQHHHH